MCPSWALKGHIEVCPSARHSSLSREISLRPKSTEEERESKKKSKIDGAMFGKRAWKTRHFYKTSLHHCAIQNRRGLAHFAGHRPPRMVASEQNVPVPFAEAVLSLVLGGLADCSPQRIVLTFSPPCLRGSIFLPACAQPEPTSGGQARGWENHCSIAKDRSRGSSERSLVAGRSASSPPGDCSVHRYKCQALPRREAIIPSGAAFGRKCSPSLTLGTVLMPFRSLEKVIARGTVLRPERPRYDSPGRSPG
jgi:hypothetical protein